MMSTFQHSLKRLNVSIFKKFCSSHWPGIVNVTYSLAYSLMPGIRRFGIAGGLLNKWGAGKYPPM